LSLHLILDASVSIIRAYSEILRGHPYLIDLVIGTMLHVSGSRINEQKTEILKIGNPDTLNHPHIHQLVKDKVKVLGIWFGKDHINTNLIEVCNC
jgi:hypothetical protein